MLLSSYCDDIGAKLVITYHSLAHSLHNEVKALRLAHTPLANRYGDFVTIPSPVPKISPSAMAYEVFTSLMTDLGLDASEFIEGAHRNYMIFGQAHPHKNVIKWVRRFDGRPARLFCFCSKPVQGASTYYETCKQAAQDSTNVVWIEKYLSDEELVGVSTFMGAGAIFDYVNTPWIGVSAAVKLLLNQNFLNIYCSNTAHFSDIPQGVVAPIVADRFTEGWSREARKQYLCDNTFENSAKKHLELYA
jgi:hypothetical protein